MMTLRRATAGDGRLLWQWRNEPLVRQNSFNTDPIPLAEHEAWFAKRLASSDTCIFLLEEDGKPVAQIRYERLGDSLAEVGDISVADDDRGKGHGKLVLAQTRDMACLELKVTKLFAVVKESNVASASLFLSAGFDLEEHVTERGCLCKRFIYSCADGPHS